MASPRKNAVRIGLIQTRVVEDPASNVRKTVARIRKAAELGARVVCLQEIFHTRYFPAADKQDVAHLAETIPGKTTDILSALASKLEIVIIVPIFEVSNGRFFNSAAVIDADGKLLGIYRKIHIPHDPFFYEQSYFEPGDLGYKVFETRYLKLGVLICYDQWFPEAARATALLGADVLFYPTAIGHLKDDPLPYADWLSAWTTIQRGHAIANFVQVAAVNRVGTEEKAKFWGSSFVCDAFGKIIRKAGTEEAVLIADLDISQNARMREGWRFTKNRRPETYASLIKPVTPGFPAEQGFMMPAEWETHEATWLAWPEDSVTFPNRLNKVRVQYLQIIESLLLSEEVHLAVQDHNTQDRIRRKLKENGAKLRHLHFHIWDYADVWFRDYGPTFVVNKQRNQTAIVQWQFNAWGGKYEELLKDASVPYFISERLGLPLYKPGIVMEGGAIDVNGRGTLMTTEQCVLNPNRNPGLKRKDLELHFRNYLGITNVIWLKSGIAGDDTDGHIDNLARFVRADTVVCAFTDDQRDENYAALKSNYDVLRGSRDQDGNLLMIIRLPMPPAKYDVVRGEKRRLAGSYVNFYIGNKVVLVPAFGHKYDEIAAGTIQEFFPGRAVIGIDCTDLIYGAGTLHCISQQQPFSGLESPNLSVKL
ncbi:MAG TPA: agmatine deiminase family protein [Terriglobia bacterium]|nr:agmatine deiminase family protein [Terriglobia bacterium]